MSKKERELRERAKKYVADAEAITKKAEEEERDMTEEEMAQVNDLLAKADHVKAQADTQRSIDSHVESMSQTLPPKARPPAPAIPDDPNPSADPRPPATPVDREAEEKYGWESIGHFARAVIQASEPGGTVDQRLTIGAAAGTGLQQSIGSSGGFLVPPSFSNQIWDGLNQGVDSLLQYCTVFPVEGESLTIPGNAETDRSSLYGGVAAYWTPELEQMTSSKPKFRQIKLEPHELTGLAFCSDKLLRNSPVALEAYLSMAMTDALNFKIGDAIINGEGGGKPLGIMKSGCLVSVTKETGQAAATLMAENIVKMYARMHVRGIPRSIWLINQDVQPQLQLMTIGVGTSGLPAYMPPGGLSGAPYGTLMGRPVVPIEYCQTLGTKGDIIFADMTGYLVGRKMGVNSAVSIHLKFDYNQTAFRFITEIDGQSALNSAITPYKGSNTISTFITLNARA